MQKAPKLIQDKAIYTVNEETFKYHKYDKNDENKIERNKYSIK